VTIALAFLCPTSFSLSMTDHNLKIAGDERQAEACRTFLRAFLREGANLAYNLDHSLTFANTARMLT
jgi:hypothetical protein